MKSVIHLIALALPLATAFAEPVTPTRIGELPPADQPAWKAYLEKSHSAAAADQAALAGEIADHNLPGALKAPSGGDFKLSFDADDTWYAGDEAKPLAAAILSYQTPSGGWSKHLGFSAGLRKPGMQWTSQSEPGKPPHYLATFDNNSTTGEMDFLANLWLATKRDDCKAAFIKGLDFISAAQFPNGGWPQVYPLEGSYHDDITFNDNAMTNILILLQGIETNAPAYAFLDEARRKQASDMLAKGIHCLLNTQIVQNGRKTAWCAQFDALTLQPSNARKMEPATLSGAESSRILKFLMSLPHPSPEIVACIESGLKWFDEVKITGIASRKVNGKTSYVADPAATEILWARFYDLKTNKPVFPGREGVIYGTFEAMAAKNKLGYDYYTTLPSGVVTNGQKKWRKMLMDGSGN